MPEVSGSGKNVGISDPAPIRVNAKKGTTDARNSVAALRRSIDVRAPPAHKLQHELPFVMAVARVSSACNPARTGAIHSPASPTGRGQGNSIVGDSLV